MISKEIIKYSIENLKKRKSRSLLTIFSIFIGITTIFIFVSFGLGLYIYVNSFVSDSSADKITISPESFGPPGLDDSFVLTDDDLEAVEKTSGVYVYYQGCLILSCILKYLCFFSYNICLICLLLSIFCRNII